jgi:hypothetical protein
MLYYSSVSERADDPMKPEEWVKKLLNWNSVIAVGKQPG